MQTTSLKTDTLVAIGYGCIQPLFFGVSSGGSFSKGFAQNYFACSYKQTLVIFTVLFKNYRFQKANSVKK
jgi:hypothetical protein